MKNLNPSGPFGPNIGAHQRNQWGLKDFRMKIVNPAGPFGPNIGAAQRTNGASTGPVGFF